MFLYLIQIFNTKMLTQYEDIYFYYFICISTPTWRPGNGLSRFSRGIWRFTLIACGPEWLSSWGVQQLLHKSSGGVCVMSVCITHTPC